jgi:hypothetical protein
MYGHTQEPGLGHRDSPQAVAMTTVAICVAVGLRQ